MSANFENKKVVVSEIEGYAKEAKAIVLVDYRGLTVAQANELRNDVRAAGGTYKVYKNRLMKIALRRRSNGTMQSRKELTAELKTDISVMRFHTHPATM